MKKKCVATLVMMLVCVGWKNRTTAEEANPLPPHPRLLFNAQGIQELKQRIQHDPWESRWKEFKAAFDKTLGEKIELPPRGSNWWHWYICPKHGARLTLGKRIGPWQWEHICPVDSEILRSDPTQSSTDYDGCGIASVHSAYAGAVREAGILYQVTGDPRYAQRGREVLLAYAERYLSYPLHTTRGEAKIGGGRVGPQTLDESVWLIPVCQGADLIWPALSDADRKTIADKLILPAARDVILAHKMGVHNIQCWKNSAVGLAGFLLDDQELIRSAIDDKDRGYRRQMEQGVQADGVWWEGAWGYHFYTVSALWPLTEAARNCGIDLYGEPFKKMFDAPIAFAMPNLVLPNFNDSGEVDLNGQGSIYELAYARYKHPAYLAILSRSTRQNNMALWFGVDQLPAGRPTSHQSRNDTASGYATLVAGNSDQATWLCLKYGPHGGGHGHPDKLNFILYSRGQVVACDAGTRSYGSPLHQGWDRATLAHNTLVADEKSQEAAQGQCLAFGNEKGVDYVTADAGRIYKGVRFLRTVALLNANLLVYVDQIRGDREHTLDIACHLRGKWDQVSPGPTWSPPDAVGYKYIKDCTTRRSGEGLTLTARLRQDWQSALTLAGGEPTEVIAGTGIGRSTQDRVPLVLFRRAAKQTAFAWSVALDGVPAKMQVLAVHDADGKPLASSEATAVQIAAAKGKWQLLVNPDKRAVRVALPDGSEWNSQATFAVH